MHKFSALEIKEKLEKKEVSSLEITSHLLQRINRVDGKVKAFLHLDAESALEKAKKADELRSREGSLKPLLGIPIAIKDNICVKGLPCTCGSRMLENFISPYNATVIQRIEEAGGVILGKTNMDEFAMGSSTENSAFFTTRNPWDTSLVPGGSSGGSAAALAAGEVSLALGSDTGGSIRQPAAFCGISGLKPTYGVVSRYGLVAFASSLDQIGPMGRSVKDLALMLSVIEGHDPKDSTSAPHPPSDYLKTLDSNLKGFKLGIPKEFMGEGLSPEIKDLILRSAQTFREAGLEIVEVSLPTVAYALAAYYIIAPAEASSNLARYDGVRYGLRDKTATDIFSMFKLSRQKGFGPEVKRRIMIGTYALSSGYYDAYYLKAQKARTLIKRDFIEAFEKCDAILSPATPTLPFKVGEKADDPIAMYLSDIYTIAVNLAGLPGLVIPAGFVNNLPVGAQLIGRPFAENLLLSLGDIFQNQTDYHKMSPTL